MATLHPLREEEPSLSGTVTKVARVPGSAPSPQSEAVTNEMQELSLQPAPNLLPLKERKNVLQLKLQQRRTREELVSQGIMPPLKSPAAFHEQRRSLERARTEDYLKRKIRSRPERSELVRMHILEETSAEPSLQAKQLQLKRARLADDLNDKISHRPGPIELVHKNILSVSVSCPAQTSLLEGESSSLDEDSSDALSPDQLTNHGSPLSSHHQLTTQGSPLSGHHQLTNHGSPLSGLHLSSSETLTRDLSPTQFLTLPPPPPPPALQVNSSESPRSKLSPRTAPPRPSSGQVKSQAKSSSERPPQRSKKAKDNKPKVKKLKYHQYIPPDQKADKERPPQMDSSYAKLLQQQQLFLQLQILSQQQQHYNYHTILPAPPKPQNEQHPATTNSGPSPSRSVPTTTTAAPTNQSAAVRPIPSAAATGAKPGALPSNLDEFKVAELKAELKLRGLTVSGTKNDLIERLRNYQEQNGVTAAALKSVLIHPVQATASVPTTPSPLSGTPTEAQHPGEGGIKITLPPQQMVRFGSTSSSPPVSPTLSERSLTGMSPNETSCNGDMFGEMVSSTLTQLTLHPSPQHPSSTLASLCSVKEEGHASCSASTNPEPLSCISMDASSMDKDQMLQEKDKQIEELTRMLRQKQRLVETLRSQLEQGKVKKEDDDFKPTCGEVKPPTLIKASAIQPPTLPNGIVLKLKREEPKEEAEEKMEEDTQAKKVTQPMQCSQETLLRLQQIHRLQVQQAEQHKQVQKSPPKPIQQKKDPQLLLRQQQQLQQLIIQQTHQKQLQAQNKLAQVKVPVHVQIQNQAQQKNQVQAQQKNQVQAQQKNQIQIQNQVHVKQVQVHIQNQTSANQRVALSQQRKQQKVQQKQQQSAPVSTQQVTSVVINQQNSSQIHTQAISLDLLKNGAPTLVTDSNGNHYLIALTSHHGDGHNRVSSLAKTNGRITLQRLQSTPTKLPSSDSQLKEEPPAGPASQPIRKAQKSGLHLDVSGTTQPNLSVTAPPTLTPFFDDLSDSESPNSIMSSLKENGVDSQQMDDLFDILLKSGEIPGFKSNPDPSLAPLHSDPPSPASPPSPLHLSAPTPSPPIACPRPPDPEPCGSGRLEDFLESTTGAPLIGVEPDGGLTLIDDLHSQMLSTPSILDHPPSPMDTSDLGFSPHSTGLDFGDPTLDSMDWFSMVGGVGINGSGGERDRGTGAPLVSPHTPPSVFSADFLDSSDLQLHWESCL